MLIFFLQVTAVDPSMAQTQFFAHLQQQASGAQQQDQAADALAAAQHEEGADMQQDVEGMKEGVTPSAENALASACEDRDIVDTSSAQGGNESSIGANAGDQQSPDSESQKSSSSAAPALDHPAPLSSSTPRVQTVQPMVSSDIAPKTSSSANMHQGKANHGEGFKTRLAAKAGARSGLGPNSLALHSAMNGECSSDLHGNMTGSRRRAVKRGPEERCSAVAPSKGKYLGDWRAAISEPCLVLFRTPFLPTLP